MAKLVAVPFWEDPFESDCYLPIEATEDSTLEELRTMHRKVNEEDYGEGYEEPVGFWILTEESSKTVKDLFKNHGDIVWTTDRVYQTISQAKRESARLAVKTLGQFPE